MANEPLQEIELNGKKLVFLFMSATVVAVVIFLSGVMVGRGVRAPRLEAAEATSDVLTDPTAPLPSATTTTSESAPATAQETLTYASRLESTTPPEETLKEVSSSPLTAPPAVNEPTTPTPATTPAPAVPAPATAPPAPRVTTAAATSKPATPPAVALKQAAPVAAPSASEPAGTGFVVQVAATRERSEADAIARRLSGKGYSAFVTTPASGPTMYRVRVGKFNDRREAEAVAGRLQKEEQFKPWITR